MRLILPQSTPIQFIRNGQQGSSSVQVSYATGDRECNSETFAGVAFLRLLWYFWGLAQVFWDQLFMACVVLTALLRALSLPQHFDRRREQSQNSCQTSASFLRKKSWIQRETLNVYNLVYTHVCVCVYMYNHITYAYLYAHVYVCVYIFLYMNTATHTCTIKALLLVRERFFATSNSTKVIKNFN